jgi:dTDP-4-dehydrorhamnose reductase
MLLTGAGGQLGIELARALAPLGRLVACDRAALDVADRTAVAARVDAERPQFIVNAAAYTAVDRAETDAKEAEAVNVQGTANLAAEAVRTGAVLVHFSTDYVFDGKRTTPYDEDAPTNPLNVYGRTKRDGERAIAASNCAHLILRTSWVYGRRGSNFLLTMQRLGRERAELRVVDDQRGVPNWTRELASAVAALIAQGHHALAAGSGVYHLSAAGEASWFEFAQAIFTDAPSPRLLPITTADYPTPARRPSYGVLDSARISRTFGIALPHWRDALARCLATTD